MISIEGLIGAGKSTLAEALRRNGVEGVSDEPVVDWTVEGRDLLKEFYEDPKAKAFEFQSFILETRERQMVKKDIRIVERSLFSDMIFAKAQHALGNLERFDEYCEIYDAVRARVPHCVGRIYVGTPVDVCMERIRLRGRDGESRVTKKYQLLLEKLHQEALKEEGLPVINIDGMLNFHDPEEQKKLVREIMNFYERATANKIR